ncbi:MAG: serine protease Do [Chthoniobacter sp.]|nr:serine protease Do [Chthoniobacter sp.]
MFSSLRVACLLLFALALRGGAEPDAGQLVHDFAGSLVFIEGGGGAGSGFICRMKDGVFVLTNQHVLAGMPSVRITRLDSAKVPAGAVQAAVGHDLMRLATAEVPNPLVATDDLENDARIGDEILVLGNSEGARVIQPLAGKLLGIGPDRIEVSAEFLPGNSGSPIVHLKSGRVIGIATYLITGRYAELTDTRQHRVRRFGFRLDSVKKWQPVVWAAFQADKVELDKVAALTEQYARLIDALRVDARVDPGTFASSAISRPLRDFMDVVGKRNLSPPDRARAGQNFLAALRSGTQSDVAQARERIRYDFFQRALAEEAGTRAQMSKLFDRLLKGQ